MFRRRARKTSFLFLVMKNQTFEILTLSSPSPKVLAVPMFAANKREVPPPDPNT